MAGLVAGLDVGGTFAGLVILAPVAGALKMAKVPTSPPNQAAGVLPEFETAGVNLANIGLIVHGTTTTTNAVLERNFSRTGFITTKGFRDVLELGRRTRPQAFGMTGQFRPVMPRDFRMEVSERMNASGHIVTDLDVNEVRAAVAHLLEMGCESLVIHFLHAYDNPAHELCAKQIAAEVWPNDYIKLGHALLSESREYERGVIEAVNAGVQPLLDRYIRRPAQDLRDRGFSHNLLVMNGNGGIVTAENVAREAVKTVMSGPATGAMAALATGRHAGMLNLLTYDMGGITTDVAMIRKGRAPVSSNIEVEFAMPIHVPMVDVRTVGAGGGSIARIDAGGMLRVGPDSAASFPGPVCYGHGGGLVTISDATCCSAGCRPPNSAWPLTPLVRPCKSRLQGLWVCRLNRPPRPSFDLPTSTWPARSVWLPCPSVPTRAISPCLPLAARGHCMRSLWPNSWQFQRFWFLRAPV